MVELQECIFIAVAVVESLHGFRKSHRMILLYPESQRKNLPTIRGLQNGMCSPQSFTTFNEGRVQMPGGVQEV
jgi:hypothetical protein